MKIKSSLSCCSLALFASATLSCNSGHSLKRPSSHSGDSQFSSANSEPGLTLEAKYYDSLLTWYLENAAEKKIVLGPGKQLLALSFAGSTIKYGAAPGESTLICGKQRIFTPSTLSNADQEAIVAGVKAYFEKDDLNIEVTGKVPETPEAATTIFFTDNYQSLGCESKLRPGYVAPLDHDNISPVDSGFVFSDGSPLPAIIDNAIAAASRSFGADEPKNGPAAWKQLIQNIGLAPEEKKEETASGDLPTVNPAYDKPATATKATALSFGKYATELKDLPGTDFLAAIGTSLPEITQENAIDTTLIDTLVKKSLPGKVTVPGLNRVVTIMEISKQAAQKKIAAENIPADDNQVQAVSQGMLNPSSLSSLGGLAAIASLGGFGSLPAAAAAAGQTYGITPDPAPLPADAGKATPTIAKDLPNFSEFLNITDIADLKELFLQLRRHYYVVDQNYTGDNRTALISMLKVAYSQVYQNSLRSAVVGDEEKEKK